MTWIIVGGNAALLPSACTVIDAGPRTGVAASALDSFRTSQVTTRALTESAAVVSEDEVAAVRIARWEAWNQRAQHLPDGYVLSVELAHPRPDQTFAVFTTVEGHSAVQSIVGEAPRALVPEAASPVVWFAMGEPAAREEPPPGIVSEAPQNATLVEVGSSAIAWIIALGEPPPKQDPPPGIVAQGSSLMAAAFAEAARVEVGSSAIAWGIALGRPPPKEEPNPGIAAQGTSSADRSVPPQEVIDRVRAARWEAWNQLAATLPDGHLLSVELLRAPSNQAVAVFTVVQGHRAFQSIVGELPSDQAATAPASAEMIALGEPPPRQPPEPGVTALGISLLSSAFSVAK